MRFSLDASWNGNYKIETISTNETKQNKAKKHQIYIYLMRIKITFSVLTT